VARLRRHHVPLKTAAVVDEKGSYLVVGGLRGLGLRIAQWLVSRGARHLVLLGRRPPDEAVQVWLQELQAEGVQVQVAQADIADRAALERALQMAREDLPPLKGVIDCAAVLHDALLEQQSAASYREVLLPKVMGAWHLHTLTRSEALDWFVLFSSMASLMGSAGQSNYAAGNAFLDALAAYRRALGLAGLSINWGAWSGSGLAAARGVDARLAGSGVELISPEEGLRWFEQLLGSDDAQVACAPINWQLIVTRGLTPIDKCFVELLPQTGAAAPEKLVQRIASVSEKERYRLLLAAVSTQIAQTIHLPVAELDPDQRLFDIGMDSLMAIEVKSRLQALVGQQLRSTLLFDFPSAAALTHYLLKDVLRFSDTNESDPERTTEKEALNEEQLAQRLAEKLQRVRQRELV
jgi:acyl carrier protein